jgi:beta-mannosidase
MRKEQSDFGWDWAPKISPAGIWQPSRVVQLNDASPVYVRNALIDIFRKGQMNNIPPDQSQPWVFNVSLDYLGILPRDSSLCVFLKDASGKLILDQPLGDIHQSTRTIEGSIAIDPRLVDLWWPTGLGSQPLYDATIKIIHGEKAISEVHRRVGFRTVVLNLLPVTEEQQARGIAPGSNFHFEVNGHEFYAKGSNLVPPDVFWPRVNETKIRKYVWSLYPDDLCTNFIF